MNEDTSYDDGHGDLIKTVPTLFGFVVEESIVILFLNDDYGLEGHIRVDNNPVLYPQILKIIKDNSEKKKNIKDYIVISYSKDAVKASSSLAEFLTLFFEDEHSVVEALFTDGETYWESLSGDMGMLDMGPTEIELKMALDGHFNYATREEAVQSLHVRDTNNSIESMVDTIFKQCPISGDKMKHWRQSLVKYASQPFDGMIDDEIIAAMIMCATDEVTQDMVIKSILNDEENNLRTMNKWKTAFIKCPERYRPLVAEMLSWALLKEGSRWFLKETLPYCNPHSRNIKLLLFFHVQGMLMVNICEFMNKILTGDQDEDLFSKFSPSDEGILDTP